MDAIVNIQRMLINKFSNTMELLMWMWDRYRESLGSGGKNNVECHYF
jgi:hypothetical protein